jgi:hypothetical protein
MARQSLIYYENAGVHAMLRESNRRMLAVKVDAGRSA